MPLTYHLLRKFFFTFYIYYTKKLKKSQIFSLFFWCKEEIFVFFLTFYIYYSKNLRKNQIFKCFFHEKCGKRLVFYFSLTFYNNYTKKLRKNQNLRPPETSKNGKIFKSQLPPHVKIPAVLQLPKI